MSMPLVSVIMSCHNDGEFLALSLESVLSQSMHDVEFIIVNDGSDDDSKHILSKYAKANNRIVLLENKNCIGLTRSLKKAISKSRGMYIARQDADDLSESSRLQQQFDFLEARRSYVLVGTGQIVIDAGDNVVKYPQSISGKHNIKKLLRYGNVFAHGSVMFRRDAYEKVGGYNENFPFAQDFDLWLRLQKIGEMEILSERLYRWRQTKTSITSTKKDLQTAYALLALISNEENMRSKANKILPDLNECERNEGLNVVFNLVKREKNKKINSLTGNALLRCGHYKKARYFLLRSYSIKDIAKVVVTPNQRFFEIVKKIYRLAV